MHEVSNFKSLLSPFIDGLLSEKRSLGFDYHTEELILARFDRYCTKTGLSTLGVTKDFLDKWCMQRDTEGLSNQRKRITVVRQLMLYMISLGINVYLPKGNGHKEVVLPHIFTQEELLSFFHEVDSYEPPLYHSVYRRLAKDSKGNKDRLVYMADDVVDVCKEYFEFLCDDLCGTPRWFFPARDPEKPLKNTSVDRVFNRFWSATAWSSKCNNKPTVHDLRFTFVTDRINLWTMEGTDLDVMMPYLQKYLGHKNLQDSYYYYHNSRMLYEAIRIKDRTAAQVIPEVTDYE